MKRMVKQKDQVVRGQVQTSFLIVSVVFFLGGLIGILVVNLASGGGEEALFQYIQGFLSAVEEQRIQGPGFFLAAWSVLRWPLFAILLSFSVVGVVGIPLLFFVRGFLFSFCVAAFIRAMGYSGALVCLLLIGVESLLTISVLFILGVQGMVFAAKSKEKGRLREGKSHYFSGSSTFLLPNLMCSLVLLVATIWEAAVVPVLLSSTKSLF